jgi:hypothetical protein
MVTRAFRGAEKAVQCRTLITLSLCEDLEGWKTGCCFFRIFNVYLVVLRHDSSWILRATGADDLGPGRTVTSLQRAWVCFLLQTGDPGRSSLNPDGGLFFLPQPGLCISVPLGAKRG